MMKRLLCILLSLMMLACSAAALAEEPAAGEAPAAAEEPAAAEAEAPAEEPAAEEAPAAEEVPAAAEEPADPEAETAAEEPAAETEKPVLLATVNGREIMSDDYGIQYFLDYYLNEMAQYGLTEEYEDYHYYYDYYKSFSLANTIRHAFYEQKAEELSLKGTEEERVQYEETLKESWKSAVNNYVESAGITAESSDAERKTAEEDALAFFQEQYGFTEESFVEGGMKEYDYFNYFDKVSEELTKDVTVSEDELQAYFADLVKEDENKYGNSIYTYEMLQMQGQRTYFVPEGYRGVTHILIKPDDALLNNYKDLTSRFAAEQEKANATETPEETPEAVTEEAEPADSAEEAEPTPEPTATPEPVTQAMIDEAKKAVFDSVQDKVDDIIAKFNAGTPFEELIAEYGEDPGMKQESYLKNGYQVHADSVTYDPVFLEAAMSIPNIGEISEPVLGSYGVHIVYYLRDIPSGAIELTDDLRKELEGTLLEQNQNAHLNELYEAWEKASDIQYTAEGQAILDAADAAQAYLLAQAAGVDQDSDDDHDHDDHDHEDDHDDEDDDDHDEDDHDDEDDSDEKADTAETTVPAETGAPADADPLAVHGPYTGETVTVDGYTVHKSFKDVMDAYEQVYLEISKESGPDGTGLVSWLKAYARYLKYMSLLGSADGRELTEDEAAYYLQMVEKFRNIGSELGSK